MRGVKTTKYLIEGNYYIIPEQYDWAVAQFDGKVDKKGSEIIDFLSFHQTLEKALDWYYTNKALKAAGTGPDGTICDLLDKLIKAQENTQETLKNLVRDLEQRR